MITIAQLKGYGFNVSQHLDQSKIETAEREIKKFYFSNFGTYDELSEPFRSAIVYLTFIYLQKNNEVFETRSGAVLKNSQYSLRAEKEALNNYAKIALRYLRECEKVTGKKFDTKNDICKIIFNFNI